MKLIKTSAALAVAAAGVSATTSLCDKYTTALLKNNTGANQLTVLTLLVNTVVIGNYTGKGTKNPTLPGSLVDVPGILAAGTYEGTQVNLAPYFSGMLKSTNAGGPAAVDWLDGGGAAPIIANPTSSGTAGSHQSTLLMHLYQYFGLLLGCTATGFPSYAGVPSMASVHQYMDITPAEMGYFITMVGAAAESFGVTATDAKAVGAELQKVFGQRCAPAMTIIPSAGNLTQAICQNSACPEASPANCSAYAAVAAPATVSATGSAATMSGTATMSGSATMSSSATMSGSATMAAASSSTAGAAATLIPGAAIAGIVGIAAMAL